MATAQLLQGGWGKSGVARTQRCGAMRSLLPAAGSLIPLPRHTWHQPRHLQLSRCRSRPCRKSSGPARSSQIKIGPGLAGTAARLVLSCITLAQLTPSSLRPLWPRRSLAPQVMRVESNLKDARSEPATQHSSSSRSQAVAFLQLHRTYLDFISTSVMPPRPRVGGCHLP